SYWHDQRPVAAVVVAQKITAEQIAKSTGKAARRRILTSRGNPLRLPCCPRNRERALWGKEKVTSSVVISIQPAPSMSIGVCKKASRSLSPGNPPPTRRGPTQVA